MFGVRSRCWLWLSVLLIVCIDVFGWVIVKWDSGIDVFGVGLFV